MAASETVACGPTVSVIVPARNEEACLGACLESLVAQINVDFEIIVVDDASADRTRELARSFPRVRVVDADPPAAGWTGKNNAMAAGSRGARRGGALLTAAGTGHRPVCL